MARRCFRGPSLNVAVLDEYGVLWHAPAGDCRASAYQNGAPCHLSSHCHPHPPPLHQSAAASAGRP